MRGKTTKTATRLDAWAGSDEEAGIYDDACNVCGGEIGPDVTGVLMCYGCGDPEVIPHEGTHCERCGTKLEVGMLLDLMCPACDGGGLVVGE